MNWLPFLRPTAAAVIADHGLRGRHDAPGQEKRGSACGNSRAQRGLSGAFRATAAGLALVLLGTGVTAAADAAPSEKETDRLLAGTVTGPAKHCIRQRELRGQTIVGQSTIVFERGSGRYYRSDVGAGCAALRPDRAIVTREIAIGICEGDPFEVFDPISRVGYGSCTFGPFIPYQRPAAK